VPDNLLAIANRVSLASARQDAEALRRLTSAYLRMYARLANQIELLAERVGDGQMSKGELARMTQWQSLRGQIEGELSDFGAYTKGELSNSAQAAIERALKDSRSLISAGGGNITAGFGTLNTAQVERLLTFLSPNSRLYVRLTQLAPVNAKAIADAFVEGVGLGWNPRKIAAMLRKQFGMALTDALRMTRTAQLYAYRETTRASYIANSNTVSGWYWLAAINNPNTCMTCILKNGTFHPNTERLNDHHNGRCAMVPAVRGYPSPFNETGEQWFMRQSIADQQSYMGKEFYAAWNQGKYKLSDMPILRENDVYGPMWGVKPLHELIGATV
jgi:hypothetical protein